MKAFFKKKVLAKPALYAACVVLAGALAIFLIISSGSDKKPVVEPAEPEVPQTGARETGQPIPAEAITGVLIEGTISYDAVTSLPTGSVMTVNIYDVTHTDVAGILIAKQTISNPGRSPVRFITEYEPDNLPDGGSVYGIVAEVHDADGNLIFINDTAHEFALPLPPGERPSVKIVPAN